MAYAFDIGTEWNRSIWISFDLLKIQIPNKSAETINQGLKEFTRKQTKNFRCVENGWNRISHSTAKKSREIIYGWSIDASLIYDLPINSLETIDIGEQFDWKYQIVKCTRNSVNQLRIWLCRSAERVCKCERACFRKMLFLVQIVCWIVHIPSRSRLMRK